MATFSTIHSKPSLKIVAQNQKRSVKKAYQGLTLIYINLLFAGSQAKYAGVGASIEFSLYFAKIFAGFSSNGKASCRRQMVNNKLNHLAFLDSLNLTNNYFEKKFRKLSKFGMTHVFFKIILFPALLLKYAL